MNEQALLNTAMMKWADDLAAQGILTTDAELKIRGWNHWLEFHSGRTAGEMIGRDLFEAYPELAERRLERYYREALEGQVGILSQRLHGYLLPMPAIEGMVYRKMRQSARIAPLLHDGKVIGTITVIDDVTERVAREAELQGQIAALEALHDIGRAILSLDLAECLQRVVDQTSALAGAEMAAVVLRDGEDLTVAACAGSEIALLEPKISGPDNIAAHVVQSGRALNLTDMDASARQLSLHPDHRCAAAAPLVTERGVIGALVIGSSRPNAFGPMDLAQLYRLATQAAIAIENARLYGFLRENEQLLSTTLMSIDDAVISADSSGAVIFINPVAQSLTGWSQEEASGQSLEAVFDIVDEESRQSAESPATRVLREGVAVRSGNHASLIARDGTERPIDGGSAPIKDEEGRVTGVVLVFRDTTERRQIEQSREESFRREKAARAQAEEASRLKDEFLATISHELRSPLNAMMGWVQLLREGKMDEAEAAHALEMVERNAQAQSRLIADLLDVSRIITGKLRIEPYPLELIPVIEAAIEAVRPAAEAKGVELRLRLDPTAGRVLGDAVRLQQIVWNLLANAIKYTPRGGRVETRLEREGTSVAIIVRDTGEGISADFLPHAFARFRQADAATTRLHGGLGLGLAIVRHLVESHGGRVSAASEGTGKGATFTVTLPLIQSPNADSSIAARGARNADPASQQSAIQNPQSKPLAGLRVLVVDDQEDARELLRLALTKRGAEVRAGASVRDALEILEQWRPDALVSDIGMPGEDGYELMRRVRALPAERGGLVPAVALTGYASARDIESVLAAGYQMFVPKPVNLADLMAAIARLAVTA